MLNPDQFPAQSAYVLHGELIDFGIEANGRVAVVTYEASLSTPDGLTIDQAALHGERAGDQDRLDQRRRADQQGRTTPSPGQVADWVKGLPH